jgi:hypothetical protein
MTAENKQQQQEEERWCLCGHKYDDHIFIRNHETKIITTTFCGGKDNNYASLLTNAIIRGDNSIEIEPTCECDEFVPLKDET